jgi:hypothetical protein
MSTAGSTSLNNFKFELPGLESRGYHSYAVATALTHSGRFNIHGREYHSYGFCSMVLQDLIAGLAPTAIVVPQFELDAFTVTHRPTISITDSIASLPQLKTQGLTPDFAIILVRAIFHANRMPIPTGVHPNFEYWGKIKIETLRVGVLVEVKSRLTRSAINTQHFKTSLQGKLQEAFNDAHDQAAAAFIAHEETNRLILVAFSGEWFSWRLAVRKDFAVKAKPRRNITAEEEGPDESASESDSGSSSESEAENPQHTHPNLDPANCRSAGTGQRELPTQSSKLTATTVEGYYAYKDPLANVTDTKVSYTPNPKACGGNSKRKSGREENTVPLRRKVVKAKFKRYQPTDLAGIMATQQLLTPEEYDDPATFKALFQKKWSMPILFGTPESKQNWFLIHRFLERINTRLNNSDGLSSSDSESDDEDQAGVSEDSDQKSQDDEEASHYCLFAA